MQKSESSKLEGTTCGQVFQLQMETTCYGAWKDPLLFWTPNQWSDFPCGSIGCLPTTNTEKYSNQNQFGIHLKFNSTNNSANLYLLFASTITQLYIHLQKRLKVLNSWNTSLVEPFYSGTKKESTEYFLIGTEGQSHACFMQEKEYNTWP